MKIVHVITRLIVGGAQENTLLSCDVTLIIGPQTGPEGSLLDRARAAGLNVEIDNNLVRELAPIKDGLARRSLLKRFRRLQPDVIHTHSSKAGIVGRSAAWKLNAGRQPPLVVHTIHGLAFTTSTRWLVNKLYVLAEKLAAKQCHKIACVATAMADQSLAFGIGRAEQYETVFSGMDIGPFLHPPVDRQSMRRQLGLAESDIAVVTIARLFEKKGHDDLLAAAPRLCRELPNLKFVWIGDGNLRDSFEQRIAEMKLQDRFILTGLVPPTDVPQLVNACDILAHPSRREGLARALPQGQLAGLPVVTYDIDGNAEGLLEGKSGYAVPPFEAAVFVNRIRELAMDKGLRTEFGQTGRAFASHRFDTQTMVDALESLYERGLAELRSQR